MNKILHITNGDSLNDRLKLLDIHGQFAVWREMLCEGRTIFDLGSQKFIETRKQFLKDTYDVDTEYYEDHFGSQLAIIAKANDYDEVVLWFEYDLFCHINLMAAISYLESINYKGPLFLVCSGRVTGKQGLSGLSEITDSQLFEHYREKLTLSQQDRELAIKIWSLYCQTDHTLLKPSLAKDSSFIYLSNCLSAHQERFPQIASGLNTLETQLLKLIDLHTITSERQYCGYGLSYQGYYGYGDIQIFKMIQRLAPYYEITNETYRLTTKGRAVVDALPQVTGDTSYTCHFGGVSKFDYAYNPDSHQLLKHL